MSTTALPPVVRSATVNTTVAEAFRVFTEEIGAWWPLPTHGLYGEQSGGLSFRDGQLIETSVDGSETVWGAVQRWDAPRRLEIRWNPGGEARQATRVAVSFESEGDLTRVTITHDGWEILGEEAIERRRGYDGPDAWGAILDFFADGTERRLTAEALDVLMSAQAAFFELAERGTFVAPPQGEFTADEVIAHVALNDAAMTAVCNAILHDREARFENGTSQDREALARWISHSDDRDGLVARGRMHARALAGALSHMTDAQRQTLVHCRLSSNEEVALDEPRPWEAVAIEIQSAHHLPAHISQLESLLA
ncbi:SRPBCC domain-containing protein [Euzebya tangerina]|uniref:SRPBCC domain-containing protein n=1 Tax=Euzebya tangerina TaxID=591198 RepID=UPI000E31A382|nr:SRPBCC domain-containing protein [Euzebya tangerina]